MWWRFLAFCVLVSFILFVVISCIHGRPVIHLFFRRCCDENEHNENFESNFLRERLVGEVIEPDNGTLLPDVDLEELIADMREKLNVHDPKYRNLVYQDMKQKAENRPNVFNTEIEVTTESTNIINRDSTLTETDTATKVNITNKKFAGSEMIEDAITESEEVRISEDSATKGVTTPEVIVEKNSITEDEVTTGDITVQSVVETEDQVTTEDEFTAESEVRESEVEIITKEGLIEESAVTESKSLIEGEIT